MMSAIGVRAWITYEPAFAGLVTLIFACAGGVMAQSNARSISTFERVRLLDAMPSSLRESFDEADLNGDGILCASELVAALRRTGIRKSDMEVEDLILRCRIDADCALDNREIDYPGFVELVRLLRIEC
eukprot:CAMPEP_0181235520 /NCGR_PEP_ID=MMETSP1096-20121128/37622_1 /TAXON_ID=156174 ORGANISM="Chrysochromulina ericina, Strain CCMP281" /NCGR_SAMPLE_ID=MMETSP1096 /ASSEMBLY_ACC=CAM_ASM_000453 /LENGTH=128 /DNA_ID=CAMNT_0023330511 /DNA_START=44 /DNA_END=430 /DNA_ORIENTATION=+